MAQSVKHQTSAQVTILLFPGFKPASSSVLTAQSPEPASDYVSPSFSLSATPLLALSLSKIINETLKIVKKIIEKGENS